MMRVLRSLIKVAVGQWCMQGVTEMKLRDGYVLPIREYRSRAMSESRVEREETSIGSSCHKLPACTPTAPSFDWA